MTHPSVQDKPYSTPMFRCNMSKTDTTNQSWGGRFSEPTDAFVARFTASVQFDQRLYRHDIQGSLAHASMLARQGVLSAEELRQIKQGLADVQAAIESENFEDRKSTRLNSSHVAI